MPGRRQGAILPSMARTTSPSEPAHVLIAGGGFGAVEAMLALRALAPERVRVTLISASPVLAYKPAATTESFDETPPRTYDLQAIAADVGASFRLDRLEAVASHDHSVRLASFAFLDYDALVLAVGADHQVDTRRADVPRPAGGAAHPPSRGRTARREDSAHRLCGATRLLVATAAVRAGVAHSHSPPGARHRGRGRAGEPRDHTTGGLRRASLAARRGSPGRAGSALHRRVRSPERRARRSALTWLRGEPGRRLCRRCTRAPGAQDHRRANRRLGLHHNRRARQGHWAGRRVRRGRYDQLPHQAGRSGRPASRPDRQRIASEPRRRVKEPRVQHVLRARLLGGTRPVFLRTELDEFGQATAATLQHESFEEDETSTAQEKVFGRYLTPYLHTREPLLSPSLTGG